MQIEEQKENTLPTERVFTIGEKRIEVSNDDLDYIFRGMRPRLMNYEDFRFVRKQLKKEVAQYLKGTIMHLAKVNDAVWSKYTQGKKIKQKGKTYIKKDEEKSND
jgi:hypothetical protein